ncbi:lytic transglycosylase domain-containing protein [Bradyrhizobium macuxiense]|uniref:lytic transglycosylase domain-containing protein n=1 Tax=Bradyrhizobium macuxiense TaxID=1755647 RepID=UPI003D317FC7
MSDDVPFAARFIESAVASEKPSWLIDDAAAASAGQPEQTIAGPQASSIDVFCRTLKDAAEASEIPVAFFARLIWQESRFRADEISHAGAQGVAQFMPETAAEVGLDDPFDPLKALPASARLLRKLRDDFGNLGLAAAAYNAGSGRIQKWLAREGELPRETRDYVRIVTGTRAEDWIEDADRLAIRIDLPREAPCEGIGGLSKSKEVTFVSALAAPGVTMIIRKAEAAELAARVAASRVRKRLAILLKKAAPGAARLGKGRHIIVAQSKAKPAKGRAIRLASRERSSS